MIDSAGYLSRLIARYWAIPVLAAAIIALAVLIFMQSRGAGRTGFAHPLPLLVVAIAALAVALPAWRALTKLTEALAGFSAPPSLTGPYAAISQALVLTDPNDAQSITIQLWRPAAVGTPLDSSSASCEAALASAALPDDLGAAPLLLYAPGWEGSRDENARALEMLARNGYIVVAIDDLAPRINIDFSTAESTRAATRAAEHRLDIETRAALSALDRLEACVASNGHASWRDRVDFRRVGFLGFSFGGAVAAEASLRDSRVAAVANLDGGLYGEAALQGARRPYLVMSSDFDPPSARRLSSSRRFEWQELYDGVAREVRHAQTLGGSLFLVRGATHDAFLDSYRMGSNFRKWLLLAPNRAEEIKHAYLLAFFDAHLRSRDNRLLSAATSPYPEVTTLNEMSSSPAASAIAP